MKPGNVNDAALLAAARTGKERFTRAELAVAAREHVPESFQLRGAPAPFFDCNALFSTLAREHGVMGRGWVERPEPGVYALTAAGRDRARKVLGAEVEGPAPEAAPTPAAARPPKPRPAPPVAADVPPQITREEVYVLRALLRTDAARAHARGGAVVTRAQASDFWRTGGGAIAVAALLERASSPGATVAPGAGAVDLDDATQLLLLHRVLRARYLDAAPAATAGGAP